MICFQILTLIVSGLTGEFGGHVPYLGNRSTYTTQTRIEFAGSGHREHLIPGNSQSELLASSAMPNVGGTATRYAGLSRADKRSGDGDL